VQAPGSLYEILNMM